MELRARDMECERRIGCRMGCGDLEGFCCVLDYVARNVMSCHDPRSFAHGIKPFLDQAAVRDGSFRLILDLFAL